MTTVLETKTTQAVSTILSAMQDLPLRNIHESKTNPRRQFDQAKLAELADNIQLHGVLQPVLVRPLPGGEAGQYELVAGARRYRASQLAKRETIPATIRELTDTECLELQLIENLQRADVHELDEARGYAALMQLQPETYTVETLAEKIGRSEKYVYARLRLLQLVDEVQQAFYTGKLTVAHAFEIARLTPDDQRRALAECFPHHRTMASLLKDKKAEAVTVRQLREWVEREVHLDLTNAPFDTENDQLLPAAGSCLKCPKRTGSNPLLFPEAIGPKKSICTDRTCYRAKVEVLVQLRVKPFEESGEKPLRVSEAPSWQPNGHRPDVLYNGQFRTVKKAECPHTKPAVVIDGAHAGTVLHVCRDEKCPVHAQATRCQPTPEERAARAKEALAERIEKQTRLRVLNSVRKKLPATLNRADLEMVALDYFRRLGHDNHGRICRVYQWEENKSKTPWGTQAVDYEAVGQKMVRAMSNTNLQQFLVVCSLASDLYCPGYNPRQPLSKDTNLALAATRYKVDIAKLASQVKAELSKKKDKPTAKGRKEERKK